MRSFDSTKNNFSAIPITMVTAILVAVVVRYNRHDAEGLEMLRVLQAKSGDQHSLEMAGNPNIRNRESQ